MSGGWEAVALGGVNTHAKGSHSVAMGGKDAVAGPQIDAIAIGSYTDALGRNSVAIGNRTHAGGYGMVALGINSLESSTFNDEVYFYYDDLLFVIGNGNWENLNGDPYDSGSDGQQSDGQAHFEHEGNRSNALTMFKDGSTIIRQNNSNSTRPILELRDGSATPYNTNAGDSVFAVEQNGDMTASGYANIKVGKPDGQGGYTGLGDLSMGNFTN